jgi:hypothetical protein
MKKSLTRLLVALAATTLAIGVTPGSASAQTDAGSSLAPATWKLAVPVDRSDPTLPSDASQQAADALAMAMEHGSW